MQKLRPYVLPSLLVFHLVVLCVMLSTVSRENEISVWVMAAVVTMVSQFSLTALFAGLGSGAWTLRIPSCGALAALSWLSFVFHVVHTGGGLSNRPPEMVWILPLAPPIGWIVLVTLLLCLRGIPFLKWRIVLQPTLAVPQSHQNSLTRGILIVVATWAGVLMLLKDSWPWSVLATEFSKSSDDLLMVSGIATMVGAGALVVTVLAVGLTLTRLADWMFYRRRWTLPLLTALLMGVAIASIMSFGGPFKDGSERLLAVLWLMAGMATQPLATLLVMGLAGYRLAARKQRVLHASELASETPQSATTELAENWFLSLQRPCIAALIASLVFFVAFVPTGALNQHRLTMNSDRMWRNNAGEITGLSLSDWATNDSLRVVSDCDKLQKLDLRNTKVADLGLMHLQGLPNLKELRISGTQITDAGLVHIKGLTKLTGLGLGNTQITDAGLVHLEGMNLKVLSIPTQAQTDLGLKTYIAAVEPSTVLQLPGWQVTDAGLMHLKGLTNLEVLSLGSCKQITDAGLVHLKAMTNLRALGLMYTQITGEGLVHLKELTNLETLDLRGTQVTDAGLVHLKELTKLETLFLSQNQITAAGLVYLKDLTKLQILDLRYSQITDAGLLHLKELTGLKTLHLRRTQITDAGIAELRKALPNCQVIK